MGQAIAPRSLRSVATVNLVNETFENYSGRKVSAVAGLIAVASFSGAEAQQSNLPPVTVDAPVERPRPAAAKPTPDQIRARNALRRAARRTQPAQVAAVPFPNAGGLQADRNPYADAAAPYKVDHVQASGKFPEPLLNTPKTVTVLSKEVLADKNATTLKQAILSTAGVTLGTGEGGNAFGDRFFIRGFDARNDIFIDGVRDSGVSVRENFFTEQVEILRGPGSSFAGRGTTGGAINIVTKQATAEKSFYNMDTTFRHRPHQARHAGRQSGDQPDVGGARGRTVPGRRRCRAATSSTTTAMAASSRRNGRRSTRSSSARAIFTPSSMACRISACRITGRARPPPPAVRSRISASTATISTASSIATSTRVGQDIGTLNGEVQITPDLTLSDKVRVSRSTLNYIGTIPESPVLANPLSASTLSANPQSRYQITDVVANQTEATYKFATDGWKHTALAGVEVSRETASIDKYTGLSSEATIGAPFTGSGSLSGVSVFATRNPRSCRFGTPRSRDCPRKSASTPRASICSTPPTTTISSSSMAAFATTTTTSTPMATAQ